MSRSKRMDAVDLVEDAGFEAVEAASAEAALLILESRPDIRVVFTDIDMPRGIDGMTLAAAVRERWPPIGIIIVSGRRQPPTIDMPDRGVFLPKPYKRHEIANTMRRMLHRGMPSSSIMIA